MEDAGPEFDSGVIEPGDRFSTTFGTVGEFPYHCHMHPGKTGTITVHAPDEDHEPEDHTVHIVEPTPAQETWFVEPAELEIQAGDTVTWVNQGDEPHNVHLDEGDDGPHAGEGDSMEVDSDDTGREDEDQGMADDDTGEEDAPGAPLFGLLVAVAVLLWARRKPPLPSETQVFPRVGK